MAVCRRCRPFDMEILPGRITGLIGPNGAGKTTMVNLITGVYRLSQGSITFGDIDLTKRHGTRWHAPAWRAPTRPSACFPDATVIANMMIGMYRHQKTSLVSQLFGLNRLRVPRRHDFVTRNPTLLERFGMDPLRRIPGRRAFLRRPAARGNDACVGAQACGAAAR